MSFDANGKVNELIEKTKVPKSNYAVTGLYFLDGRAPELASKINPSERRELEIVDLLTAYLQEGSLNVETFGGGFAWFDTGTCTSLLDAGNFVRTITKRQSIQVGSPDAGAFRLGWSDGDAFASRLEMFGKSAYGTMLRTPAQGAAQ